ncbi:MAG: c-type cytochrome [Gemmataceae bacterium]
MSAPVRTPARRPLAAVAFGLLAAAVGCQQRMAEQPAPRPYEQSTMFEYGQSARPLERGVVHRNQAVDDDPVVTWLTAEGRKGNPDAKFTGDAAYDPKNTVPPMGAPTKVENFVGEIPVALTEADLKRGQSLFNANCALCHGAAGYGNGKIVERGVLRPPSYHADPAGAKDWSTLGADGKPRYEALDAGYSRGFYRWGVKVPLRDVPVGYIFQVITWGFGGMAAHDVQVADPVDRWRVVAYVRTLQMSQNVPADQLPAEAKTQLNQPAAGGAKNDKH